MTSELDDLLSRPLAEMPDAGFTARTLAKISARELHLARIEAISWIVLVLAATAALATSRPGRELAAMALSLGIAAQIAVILTIVLMVFALRETAE